MSGVIVHSDCGVTLVGGGELSASCVTEALTIAPCLVAADGGADAVLRLGLVPQAVIGDLDSITSAARAALAPERLHLIAEQDTTDFDKCLRSIAAPFVLAVGFSGARMDHGLAVFHGLVQWPDARCVVVGPQDICFLAPPEIALDLAVGTRLSLFPMGAVRGTGTGLRWPVDGLDFAPDTCIGTSNQTSARRVVLGFDQPLMLIILPTDCLSAVIAAWPTSPWPARARGG